jgi:hypothetical protein
MRQYVLRVEINGKKDIPAKFPRGRFFCLGSSISALLLLCVGSAGVSQAAQIPFSAGWAIASGASAEWAPTLVESVPEPDPKSPKSVRGHPDSRTDRDDAPRRGARCRSNGGGGVVDELGSVVLGLLTLEIPETRKRGRASKYRGRCRETWG